VKRDIPIALALFVLAVWHALSFVDVTDFHRDEARWIHRAHFFRDFTDPASPTWDDGIGTRGQPPLGSYLMGLGLTLQGRDLDTNGWWEMGKSEAWNRARGRMPVRADLEAGRRTNAVINGLTVVAIYFLARRLSNRLGGFVAGFIFAYHPLATLVGSRAFSDPLLGLLVALAALTAVALADRPSWPRAVLLGVLLGLGGAAKLSPLLLAVPLALVGLALLVHGMPWRLPRAQRLARRRPLTLGWMLLVLPVVAFAAFVAAYPYLWSHPVERSLLLFDFRTSEMENQGEIWENHQVDGPTDAFERVGTTLGQTYSTSDYFAQEVEARTDWTWDRPELDLRLGVAGLVLLALLALLHGATSRYGLAAFVLFGQAALIILGMQADFERYHLPILVATATGAGLAVGWAYAGGQSLWTAAVPAALGWLDARRGGTPERPTEPVPAPVAPRRPALRPTGRRAPAAPAVRHATVSLGAVGRGASSWSRYALLAAVLALGALIGHGWAGLRPAARPAADPTTDA
jgi:Dolichyl-phosphate-mannose-protein mannosyltransferase